MQKIKRRATPWRWVALLSIVLGLGGLGFPTRAAEGRVPNGAEWERHTGAGVRLHVLPGTAAARDAALLTEEAEASLERVAGWLDVRATEPLDVYLVERVFWQGGAAYGSEILLTYGDRSYIHVPLHTYLDHETVHALAAKLVPEEGETNTLLAEGLATWLTGGHYGPEPLHALAAALTEGAEFIPLEVLLQDFRGAQHESAYVEAASFVGWLIEQVGLDTFKAFYGAAAEPERFYGQSYTELEDAWLHWLKQEQGRGEPDAVARWRAQRTFFEVLRAYEIRFDPLARRLPDPPSRWSATQRGLYDETGDAAWQVALETQLIAAHQVLQCGGDLAATKQLLAEVEAAISTPTLAPDSALARRLRAARWLGAQEAALRRGGAATLWSTMGEPPRGLLGTQLLQAARWGPVEQEVVRLRPVDEGLEATVIWTARTGGSVAYRLRLQPQGEGWRLTSLRPFPVAELIPRSEPQCNP